MRNRRLIPAPMTGCGMPSTILPGQERRTLSLAVIGCLSNQTAKVFGISSRQTAHEEAENKSPREEAKEK